MTTKIFEKQRIEKNQNVERNNAQRLFIRNQSYSLFKRIMRQGKFRRWINSFSRKSSCLVSLSAEIHPEDTKNIFECGMQSVPLCMIIGSENRCHDFDYQFTPRSFHTLERWMRISDMFLMDEYIPPVKLIRVGAYYFVRDGHHRISVAKALGKEYIDACVSVYQIKEGVINQLNRNFYKIDSENVYLN